MASSSFKHRSSGGRLLAERIKALNSIDFVVLIEPAGGTQWLRKGWKGSSKSVWRNSAAAVV
jgi:hypothetical protein